jgi:hypothetical protein
MKTYISEYSFMRAFKECRPDNFSYDGLKVLFEYLEEYEMDTGDELELDVIGLCCDFAESTWEAIASDYDSSIELDINENDDEQKAQVLDFLADQGALIGETSNSIVYRQF